MSCRQWRIDAHGTRWLAFRPWNAARCGNLLGQERYLRQRRFGERLRRGAKCAFQRFERGIRSGLLFGLGQTLNSVKKGCRYIVDNKGGHNVVLLKLDT